MMSHFVECNNRNKQDSCAKSNRAVILSNIQSAALPERYALTRHAFESKVSVTAGKAGLYGGYCGAAVECTNYPQKNAGNRRDARPCVDGNFLEAFKDGIKCSLQGFPLEYAMNEALARPFPADDFVMLIGEQKYDVLVENGVADPDLCVTNGKSLAIQRTHYRCALLAVQRSGCYLEAHACKIQSAHMFGGFERVDLQGNELQTVTLASCDSLRCLILDNNTLSALDCSCLPYLEELRAEHNKISEVALAGAQIYRIFLKGNRIWRFSTAALPKLATLDLSSNKLQALSISDASELSTVFLGENLLTALRIERCPNLRFLDAHGNQLYQFRAEVCPTLQFLDLSSNLLGSADLEQLTCLKRLFLNDNMLENVQLPSDAHFEIVNLLNNKLKYVCVDRSRCKKLVFDVCVKNEVAG